MTMLPNGRKAGKPAVKSVDVKPAKPAEPLTAAVSEALGFKDDRDLGFQFAQHVDADGRFVAYFRAKYPGATDKDKIPEEFTKSFRDGCILRHADIQTATVYVREGEDNYRAKGEGETVPDGKALTLSVGYCTSMSTHEFGKLAPNLKRLVKTVRDRAKNYADVRFSRFVKALFADAESAPRASNKTWAEWFEGVMGDAVKKAKRATEKGDASAPNPDALRVKIEAFKAALKA